jgi:hypothetical protein
LFWFHVSVYWLLINHLKSGFLLPTSLLAGPELILVCISIELIMGRHPRSRPRRQDLG